MYIVVIFFTILSIVALKEVLLYYRVKKRNIDLVAFRLLSRFNYLIVIQSSTLIWQFIVKKDIGLFPFWMLLFLFYGPYVFLIIYHYLFKEKEKLFGVYFKDYYLSLFLFVLLSFIVFYVKDDLRFIEDIWYYSFYVFVMMHLLFYGIKGFYLLKDRLSEAVSSNRKEFKAILYLSYLISFTIVFSIIIFIFLTLFDHNYDVLFVFSILTLLWLYVIVSTFRYNVISDTFKVDFLTQDESFEIYSNTSEVILTNQVKSESSFLDYNLMHNDEIKINVFEVNKDVCDKYDKVRLSEDFLEQIDIKVKQVILVEKAFLDPNFKISDLAIKIKVSRYYLAQYFTYKHKMSFREYINSLRIKEILDKVDKLTCKKEMTANELFFQSAFNSKASFFKSFKNVTGMTPAEYIKLV